MVRRKGLRYFPAHDFDVLTPAIWDEMLAVAIASSGGAIGKGDSHTEETRERIRRRRKRKPRTAKSYRKPERDLKRVAEKRGGSIEEFVLAAMIPGEWHASPDIAAALPMIAPRSLRSKMKQRLLPRGFIERIRNPEYRTLPGGARFQGLAIPEYLYRLTEAGEIRRAAFLAKRGGSL